MFETLKELLAHPYEAALCMQYLAARCPDATWNGCVAKWKFCQTAFHTAFFADVYLQPRYDVEALKRQPFHLEHADDFRDYEELEDRRQILLYERPFVLKAFETADQQ